MNTGFGWSAASLEVRVTHRDDGSVLVTPTAALGEYPDRVTDRLDYWAEQTPDRIFLAQRDVCGQWQPLSYAQVRQRVLKIAASLAARQQRGQLSVERPVMVLSPNSSEHLLIALAAMYVGIPYAPISLAYAVSGVDTSKLQHVLQLLTPGMLVALDGAAVTDSLRATLSNDVELVSDLPELAGRATTSMAMLEADEPSQRLMDAHACVNADSIAKFLMTSGSTGNPKAVTTTHRMLCSNQRMLLQALPFVHDEPPVLVDWLPWNHTFGGSHNVNLVLFNGGTLYIDAGRPMPGEIEVTVRNICEVAPTICFNVPKGFELLALKMQSNAELCTAFFKRLRACFFAGAGLSQPTWDILNKLSLQQRGAPLPFISGLGATECSPLVTITIPGTHTAGFIGLPAAGNDIKLAPMDGKLEMRVKGPNIMPGYWRQPELTASAFDDEGYYCLGDAVAWVDEHDPRKGLYFDGRIAEDFKLSSGTWVSVGPLRANLLAALHPLVHDVVIVGMNYGYLGVLIFPHWATCAALAELPADASRAQIAASAAVRAAIVARLGDHVRRYPSSSTRIGRACLLLDPPSAERGELTDKGSINQRAVARSRADIVHSLYDEPPACTVITIH